MMGLKQGPVSLMAPCPFRSSIVCWILPSLSQTHIAHGSRVSVLSLSLAQSQRPTAIWDLSSYFGCFLGQVPSPI